MDREHEEDDRARLRQLAALMRCPDCQAEPLSVGETLLCTECSKRFPCVGPVPVVFAEPDAWLERFKAGATTLRIQSRKNLDTITAELGRPDLSALSRDRLAEQAKALRENVARALTLLQAGGITADAREVDPSTAIDPMQFLEQVVRDWAWGDDALDGEADNEVARTRCERALREGMDLPEGSELRLGTMLVLGAGGSRLAYDLHRKGCAEHTVAVDINPLSLLVAAKVVAGEEIVFFDSSWIPKSVHTTATSHTLRAPRPLDAGMSFVLSDGIAPSFRDGAFDTVLTPWFIDQGPDDLAAFARRIRRLLRAGGRWLNFGPLLFGANTRAGDRRTREEVEEIVIAEGFSLASTSYEPLVYRASPITAQARIEHVFTFLAVPTEGQRKEAPVASKAPWEDDLHANIPRFEGLDDYVAPHPLLAALAAAIDGTKSAVELVPILFPGEAPKGAAAGLLAAAREIYRACRRS